MVWSGTRMPSTAQILSGVVSMTLRAVERPSVQSKARVVMSPQSSCWIRCSARGQAQAGRAEIDPLLVPGGGIARLPQGAAGLAHRVAGKGGALEQQAVGLVVHARVGAAPHAGQGHRLFGVADDEVVFGQGELLLVQGDDLFAGAGAADVDAAAGHLVQVEGVHGLAHLQQGVVGDVHHVADGAQAAQGPGGASSSGGSAPCGCCARSGPCSGGTGRGPPPSR